MKKTYKLAKQAALAAVLTLASSALLNAQTNQAQFGQPESRPAYRPATITPDPAASSQAAQPVKINRASSLIGATVKNQQGLLLGKIHDIVIDLSSERVAYAVLDSGAGVLNPQKLHAVPLRAFQADADGKTLILNADRQKLVQSEGFDKNNWPGMTTAAWGAEPFWKDAQGTSSSPEATDAEKRSIKKQQDKQLKDFKDATTESKKSEPQSQP
jgi:sporulation protein YlmC with PRC-barrel domain